MIIPDNLWRGEKEKYEELLDEWFATDSYEEDEYEKLMARMVKELKDEPEVLEYIGIY